jgi:phosphate transport system protein
MVKESLDCFVRGDVELAKKILMMDDEVDGLKNKVFKDQLSHMKTASQDVEASLDLILVARNLERLGDHATNIAEDVIFAFTGKDVRHGGKYT